MLIAIEGIDASGKQTQTQLLVERAQAEGLVARCISFPRYGATRFGQMIRAYLRGELGKIKDISPRLVATLYAGDRFESLEAMNRLMVGADLIVCDRYVASNLAYQAAKVDSPQRREMFEWIDALEHTVYALPRPDMNIFLDVPLSTATYLMVERRRCESNAKPVDLHEESIAYLAECRAAYLELIDWDNAGDWRSVGCTDASGIMLDRGQITNEIWKHVEDALGARVRESGVLWGRV
ncbi:MAG: dTMP kinase [Phycisphaeraceae bacterium]|nr:dTMP kinase [Phycisphaeraceae bacterium]